MWQTTFLMKCRWQESTTSSVLRLSDDQSSFYVGYSFSGRVEKYSIDSGLLVCSTLAHYGDVHTLTPVRPDVLCTSGSDGHVRLVDMTSNESVVKSATPKPAVSFSPDEQLYKEISNGVLSIQLIQPQFRVMVCSSGAPQMIGLHNSLSVQSLGEVANDNIGKNVTLRYNNWNHHHIISYVKFIVFPLHCLRPRVHYVVVGTKLS